MLIACAPWFVPNALRVLDNSQKSPVRGGAQKTTQRRW